VIVESPNRTEDERGELMVGDSADLLITSLTKVGFKPEDIYFTSLTKCISYEGQNVFSGKLAAPPEQSVQLCASTHLQYEFQRFKNSLRYVITCGSTATKLFLPSNESGILSIAGNEYPVSFGLPDGTQLALPIIPIPSPTYVMMNFSYHEKFIQILQNISNKVSGVSDVSSQIKSRVLEPWEFLEYTTDLITRYKNGNFPYVVFDIETKNLEWNLPDSKIIGYCFSDPETREGFFVGVEHPELLITVEHTDLVNQCVRKILRTIPIVGHNIIFDLKWCHKHLNIPIQDFKIYADTLYMGYYIFGARRDSGIDLNLKDLSRLVLGFDMTWEKDLHEQLNSHRLKKDRHFFNVKYTTISTYGALDAIATLLLFEALDKRMREYKTDGYQFLLRSIPVFIALETEGIQIDWAQRDVLITKYTENIEFFREGLKKLPTVETFIVNKTAEKKKFEFNPNSLLQLQELFYSPNYLHCPVVEMTEGNKPSVAESALQIILKTDDIRVSREAKKIAQIISSLRGLVKILSTYLEPLSEPESLHPETGMYLPDYNVIGTATGRLSSYFHTLPSGNTDVKRLVSSRFAETGGLIMAADYSQLEVRVIGALANDDGFISAYKEGLDVHALTAGRIFNKPVEQVSKKERKSAKAVVFGILYGKQSKSLSEELGISIDEAQTYIDYFFKGFPNVKSWINEQHKFLRANKYVTTPFGRRRWLRSIDSKQKFEVLKSEREAQNSPIQSTSCFTGDTEIIVITEGGLHSFVKIEDLVGVTDFRVLSSDKSGNIVFGKGHSARKTTSVTILCSVSLISGQTVTCTPDHLFLLTDGTYCEAQNLTRGHELSGVCELGSSQTVKIDTVSLISSKEEISVYDISVDEYHNFALASGVFVHNSDLTFDATLRIQEHIWNTGLRSKMIGTVHDSIEVDVFPSELIQIYDVFKLHMETIPQERYQWLNGMPLRCDVEIGSSWGGACELEIEKHDDGSYHMEGSGFEQDLQDIVKRLAMAYDVEVTEISTSEESVDNVNQFINAGDKIEFKLNLKERV